MGFFDLMNKADIFVVLDDVQYTVRDWRSRNRIKSPNGILWLTVPVQARGARSRMIKDIATDDTQQWQEKHLKSLETSYRKAKYFHEIFDIISGTYQKKINFLIDIDMELIMKINHYLSLETKLVFSSEISSEGTKDVKLLSICKALNATIYLSGNAAKEYLRESIFVAEGIKVNWHDYEHPFYNQLWVKEHGFISHLSLIDLVFNHGPESLAILTGQKMIKKPEGIVTGHADKV
ncbi:MAG: WbqC family protein [Nitrospirae bacterium]|nr:WbqC family protein [Nitrospirota bacterium]